MSHVLFTTASDDNIINLSKVTLKQIRNRLSGLDADYVHFHDGVLYSGEHIKVNHSFKCANPTNNIYRNIVEYLRSNPKYKRWLHFDGDMFIGGLNPLKFLQNVIAEDKVATRLQCGQCMNIQPNGELVFILYEVISSQCMYISAEEAVAKCDEFIYQKNVPWTFECSIISNYSYFPYQDMPLWLIPIHTHNPHDKTTGDERLRRLNLFLKKWHCFEQFKYRDSAVYPWAKKWYDLMFEFRTKLVGMSISPVNNILLQDNEKLGYSISWEEAVKKLNNNISIEEQYTEFLKT